MWSEKEGGVQSNTQSSHFLFLKRGRIFCRRSCCSWFFFLHHRRQEGGEADVMVLGTGGHVDDQGEDRPTDTHLKPFNSSGELLDELLHGLFFLRGLRGRSSHHHHLFSSHVFFSNKRQKTKKKKVEFLPRSRATEKIQKCLI